MAPSTLPPPVPTRPSTPLPPPSRALPPPFPPLTRSRVTAPQRPRRQWSPVGVIATTGVVFILIAALSVTISRWETIGAAFRAGGLAVFAALAVWLAERIRQMAPTTATAVAVVGTGLAFPVGVAAMSALGYTWPVCLTVGALLASPLTEWQRRRWPPTELAGRSIGWFDVLQVGALATGSFGLAALVHVPAGLIAVAVAAVLVALGASSRSVALSALAVAAPVLGVLADSGIGAGTLARAGVVGERLGWFGPLVGIAAAGVVLAAGRRVGSRALSMLSPMFAVAGIVTGLAAIDAAPAAWASVPGILLAAVAGMWQVAVPHDQRQRASTVNTPGRINLTAVLSTTASLFGGFVAIIGAFVASGTVPVAPAYAISATTWAIGLAMCWPAVRRYAADLVLSGIAASSIVATSAIVFRLPLAPRPMEAALIGIVAGMGALVSTWLARTPLATSVTLTTSLVALLAVAPSTPVIAAVLLAAWLAVATLALALQRPPAAGWSVSVVGLVTAFAATWIFRSSPALRDRVDDMVVLGQTLAVFLVALLVAAGALAMARSARRFVGWPIIIGGGYAFAIACGSHVSSVAVAASFAAVAVAAVAWHRLVASRVSRLLVGGAFGATVATTIAAVTASATVSQFVLLVALALSAMLMWVTGRSISLTVGAGTIAFAAAAATTLPFTWVTATWFVIGVAGAMLAWRWEQPWLAAVSGAVAVFSAVVWIDEFGAWDRLKAWLGEWFSGLTEWLTATLATIDMTPDDAAAIVVFAAALVGASALVRKTKANSLLLFGPVFLFMAMVAVPAEIERHPMWTIPFAVAVGVVATFIGARRKIIGLLVGGIGLPSAVVLVASRATLVLVPGWVWVGLGGVVLLGTALVVERVAGGWEGVRRQANYLARIWR